MDLLLLWSIIGVIIMMIEESIKTKKREAQEIKELIKKLYIKYDNLKEECKNLETYSKDIENNLEIFKKEMKK